MKDVVLVGLSSLCYELRIHLSYHTAVIPPPQLKFIRTSDSVARIIVGKGTADRSERYISSLARTDLAVPLEVEFEKTQSVEVIGDMIDRHVSAPGAVYNVQIWSINGANFSYEPAEKSTPLLYATGKNVASIDIHMVALYTVLVYISHLLKIHIMYSYSTYVRTYFILLYILSLHSLHSPHCPSTAVCHSRLL